MRTLCSLCVVALAMVSGCWPHLPQAVVQDQPPPVKPAPRPPRSLVTPDQVTPGNAREIAEALWEEVDREQTPHVKPSGSVPAAPRK